MEYTIRDLVNQPRRQNQLIENKENWQLICSSMDILEDTELALDSYKKMRIKDDVGIYYLIIYGVLQTLILQQDAIKNILRALSFDMQLPTELLEIREIRNNAVGHPVREKNKKINSINFITRMSLRKNSFELGTWTQGSGVYHDFTRVDIYNLIDIQEKNIKEIKSKIIDCMLKEDKNHIDKFKKDKLLKYFGDFDYYSSALFEGLIGSRGLEYAKVHYDLINEIIETIKKKLQERNEDCHIGINDTFEELVYPMKKIEDIFNDNGLQKEEINIYLFYIKYKMDELQEMIKELDEEYNI
jgi:hypothetical protein